MLKTNLMSRLRALFLFLIFVLIWGGRVMAKDSENTVMKPGAFSLSWSGGLQYGSRQMTFDGQDKFYFAKGDTINDETQTGIGVFELEPKKEDVQALKEVAKTLCDKDIQAGGPEAHDPAATFNTVCFEGDKAVSRSGSLRLVPEQFRHRVFDVPFSLSEQARTDGKKIIKLDFTTVGVERKEGHYIVSVQFINSGHRWIKFRTPDQWSGDTQGGDLGVAPFSELGKMQPRDDWGFGLAGKRLINKGDFADGLVTLHPGERKIFKFESIPDNRISKGEYELSGAAFMRIEYEGYGWGLSSQVDFRPIRSRITIDHDYPSTPQEREQWEATHRASMSSRPVNPGETFAEDGLYRAVRTGYSTYRSLQLVPFKAGAVATTEPVQMLMERGNGVSLNGPVQWLWEASAPTPVKQYSFDLIEETRQFCEPGSVCPRSGRWLPRIRQGWQNDYRYDFAGVVTVQRGRTMPTPKHAGGTADWEWVGA